MSTEQQSTRRERRDAARAERKAAEEAAAAKARRQRRLFQLGGVAALAIVVVVVALVVSGGKSGSNTPTTAPGDSVAGQSESAAMLDGIPQSGLTLGKSTAPVTMLEFADLQCPYCREYSLQTLPTIVQDYVRTGKVKIEFRNLSFIGDDSVTAGRYAAAAAQQNKLWNFIDVFYYNQKEENSGYVTDSFLKTVASGVAGLDAAKAQAYAQTSAASEPLTQANSIAAQYNVTGTPTLVVGKTGGKLTVVDGFATADVKGAIDTALKGV